MSDAEFEITNDGMQFTEHQFEFDEIEDIEQQIENISVAQQNYIQNNYKKLSIEDLERATHLSGEVIKEYIHRYEGYLLSRGINPDGKFVLSFTVDNAGNVGYGIQWPKTHEIDVAAEMFGKLIYLITNKKLNESVVNFLLKVGAENNAHNLVQKILMQWKEQEDIKKKPLIRANEVIEQ